MRILLGTLALALLVSGACAQDEPRAEKSSPMAQVAEPSARGTPQDLAAGAATTASGSATSEALPEGLLPDERNTIEVFRRVSPVIDHYDRLPELSPDQLAEWAALDTHDALTDRYKHVRTSDQVHALLAGAGLVDLEVVYAGNGVEARARKARRPEGGTGS